MAIKHRPLCKDFSRIDSLKYIITFALFSVILFNTSAQTPSVQTDILQIINKVNTYWQTSHPRPATAAWDEAAYHTGNLEAYKITQDKTQLHYSIDWANRHQWMGARSNDMTKWKYSYGETDDFVLFGDWQICFQVYADLFTLTPDSNKIARARQVMEYQMSTTPNDYWWWIDALYMVMPVMTKMYHITGNDLYLQKLYDYFKYADSIMYDPQVKLYYRDARYVYPKHKTSSGKKDFWARGDGWAFAAFARIINDLPNNYKYRTLFIERFCSMAEAIVACQQNEGYWTRSLLDPQQAPGYETSGTAFFTYGLLWGINNGFLKDKKYAIAAQKGWNYLTKIALQPSGRIGYVQPIGDKAIAGQVLNEQSTSNFGVGAFLLAAAEMGRYTTIIR